MANSDFTRDRDGLTEAEREQIYDEFCSNMRWIASGICDRATSRIIEREYSGRTVQEHVQPTDDVQPEPARGYIKRTLVIFDFEDLEVEGELTADFERNAEAHRVSLRGVPWLLTFRGSHVTLRRDRSQDAGREAGDCGRGVQGQVQVQFEDGATVSAGDPGVDDESAGLIGVTDVIGVGRLHGVDTTLDAVTGNPAHPCSAPASGAEEASCG